MTRDPADVERTDDAGRTVTYGAWRAERRRSLADQLDLLGERTGPRTHRPRSDEEWDAIADGVRAEWRRREAGGRWVWVAERRVLIRPAESGRR